MNPPKRRRDPHAVFWRWLLFSIGWKVAVILLWLLCVYGFPISAQAADNFWQERAIGWHWYQDPADPDSETPEPMADENPVQQMTNLQHYVQQTLDQAILNPTIEHVKNYIALQNALGAQATRFTQVWQSVLLNYPELDYSLRHPTNGLAKQIELDQTHQQENAAIAQFAQHSGLFFFYRSTCPYCQRFAPILKEFAQRYQLAIVPITTDGVSLPEFPQSHINQGQAERLKVTLEPAVFTADPTTHRIIPVSYGLLSEDELRQRILTIAQQSLENKP
jgi:conjugal transfer pilus assembly protein TraF